MSYDSPLDGIALTYKLNEYMPENHSLALRAIYTPFTHYKLGATPYVAPPTTQAGGKMNTVADTVAAQIDYSIDKLSWADSMGLVLQHFQTGDLYYPTAAGAGLTQDSTLFIAVGGTTLAAEFMGIAQTGLDVSMSYLSSSFKSEGRYSSTAPVGLGTNSQDETLRGGIFLLSTRYRLASWLLGFEYVNGSDDSFYYAGQEETLTNFYATKGNAFHLYVTKKFNPNLSLRVGYMDQQYDYTPFAVGANKETDRVIQTGYANLRLDF